MKALFTFLLFLTSFSAFAQIPQPAMISLETIGGRGSDYIIKHVNGTSDGGFIILITTDSPHGTGNLDTFADCTKTPAVTNIYSFIKYNSDATVLEWSRCFDFSGDSGLIYLFPATGGSYVLGGMFNSHGYGFLICKQDAAGNILWQEEYSKGNSSLLRDMIATSDGGYLMMGKSFYTDTNVLIHYGGWTDADIWLLKLDSNGNKEWSKVIGGTGYESPAKILETSWGDYYLVGSTGSNDYDCTGNHGGDNDLYVARLDKEGNIKWHRNIGGSGNDGSNAAVADGNGGVIIAGLSNSADGDVTHPTSYGGGIWLLNIDSAGNKVWDNSYGGAYCYSNSVCRATDGSVWVAGVSSHTGSGLDTAYGRDDAWIVHTDSVGNLLNAKVLGSNMDDRGTMIHSLSNGNVIAGGYYSDSNGAFVSITHYGADDAFLGIFAPWNQTSVPRIFGDEGFFKAYPNPALSQVTIELNKEGSYTVRIYDVVGEEVYNARLNSSRSIAVNGWPKGVYNVQVTTEAGYRWVQKLIVQ